MATRQLHCQGSLIGEARRDAWCRGQPSLAFARLARQSIILWCSIMTTRPDPTDLSERYVDPPRDHDFPAKRHTVPLAIGFPNVIGFSSACIIAPGLEIREATQTDIDRLDELNKTWASTLSRMHMVPLARSSHVICIDEQLYGHYVEQNKPLVGRPEKVQNSASKGFASMISIKMIVTALHLFRLVPLYVTRYFITEEYDKNFVYPGFLSAPVQVIFDLWQRYAVPSGYTLPAAVPLRAMTSFGLSMCWGSIINTITGLKPDCCRPA